MSVQCQFKRNALGRLVGLKRPIWAEIVSVLWICSRGSSCVKLLFSDSVNAVNANCRCGFWLCFLRSSFRLFCCEKNRLFSGVKEDSNKWGKEPQGKKKSKLSSRDIKIHVRRDKRKASWYKKESRARQGLLWVNEMRIEAVKFHQGRCFLREYVCWWRSVLSAQGKLPNSMCYALAAFAT